MIKMKKTTGKAGFWVSVSPESINGRRRKEKKQPGKGGMSVRFISLMCIGCLSHCCVEIKKQPVQTL